MSYLIVGGISKFGVLLILGLEIVFILDSSFYASLFGVAIVEIILLFVSWLTARRFSNDDAFIQNLSHAATPIGGQVRGFSFTVKYAFLFFVGFNIAFWVLYGIYLWIG